ncbi:hypothetical protein [Haloarcula rubripromontorii]|nr:hypothetical protein [Haloarcula rubripromontorii]
MKRGGIAVVTDSGHDIDDAQFPKKRTEDGHELLATVDVDWQQSMLGGQQVAHGRIAEELTAEIKTTRIRTDGGVEVGREETDVVPQTTEFSHVPGEFFVTESTQDEFADQLMEEATGETIHRAQVDLESFAAAHPNADPWMGWFRSGNGPIDSGAAYGDIDSEPDLVKFIHSNENSQLGLTNLEYEGQLLKLVLSEGGWLAIYNPKDRDRVEFTRFIHDEVLPHTSPKLMS